MKKVFCLFICSIMACCTLMGCQANKDKLPSEEAVVGIADKVNAIHIVNDTNKEKVITEPNFTIPSNTTANPSVFTLPGLVGKDMVLQANMVTRVWGSCSVQGPIAVRISDLDGEAETVTYYSTVKADNTFEIFIGAHDYGESFKLDLITNTGLRYSIGNVAFGELYLAGGQSNMGWTLNQCYGKTTADLIYKEDIANAGNKNIRFLHLYPKHSTQLKENISVQDTGTNGWAVSSPGTVPNLSAAAYFFARELNKQYNIPVGVIIACMGGTMIHTWLPAQAYEKSVKIDGIPDIPENQGSVYFNAMINPLRKVVARGMIWYQGDGQWQSYAENFKLLTESWREVFGLPKLFMITLQHHRSPNELDFFKCREEHKKGCNLLTDATYANAIDTGLIPKNKAQGDNLNAVGEHPYQKKEIGQRFCYAAMDKFYHAEGVWSGPTYAKSYVVSDGVVVEFDNVGFGLQVIGNAGFELAGADNRYYEARVEYLSQRRVKVTCEKVTDPVKIRYGMLNKPTYIDESDFTDYSQSVSVYNTKGNANTKGLPAEQFEVVLS